MKPLPLEALAQYTYLSGINTNIQGTYGAYVAHNANLENNDYDSDIWLLEPTGTRRLTTNRRASSFEWLPDGDRLIYPSMKDPAVKTLAESGVPLTVYYSIPVNGGESTEFMRIPMKVSQIYPITDTLFLLSAQHHPEVDRYNQAPEEARPAILKQWKEDTNYEGIEEIPFWSNGGTFLRGARNRLYAYCNLDKVLLPLTDPDTSVSGWHYEPAHDRLVAITKTYRGKAPLKSALQIANGLVAKLRSVDFETAAPTALADQLQCVFPQGSRAIHYAYSLDADSMVVLANDGTTHGLNQNAVFSKLSLLDSATPSPILTPFAPEFTGTVGNTVGSDGRFGAKRTLKSQDGVLYFISTERESAYLNRLLPTGQLDRLTPTRGSVDDFALLGTSSSTAGWSPSSILLIAMRENRLAEVFSLHEGLETALSHHNDPIFDQHPMATPQEITLHRGYDENGQEITVEGWVLEPIVLPDGGEGGEAAANRGKAILNIHGGPKTVYGPVFYHEMQYWANLGYHVMFCNPRGSDGKGNDFADIRGKYGSIDYEDIMSFVDQVLEAYPAIEADKLYVTGGSYGGFMTNWIVGHTNRFRAAASQRSISNWTTEYGVTDIGYYFVPDQIGATPWSNYQALWDMSPLKYAPNIETPLLLEHSDQDYRCWLPEALQLFTALKDMGKEARIIMTKGENHELSRSGKPKSRIKRIQEITDWFKKY